MVSARACVHINSIAIQVWAQGRIRASAADLTCGLARALRGLRAGFARGASEAKLGLEQPAPRSNLLKSVAVVQAALMRENIENPCQRMRGCADSRAPREK